MTTPQKGSFTRERITCEFLRCRCWKDESTSKIMRRLPEEPCAAIDALGAKRSVVHVKASSPPLEDEGNPGNQAALWRCDPHGQLNERALLSCDGCSPRLLTGDCSR
eukprot:3534176-Amphidinium_carterae.1